MVDRNTHGGQVPAAIAVVRLGDVQRGFICKELRLHLAKQCELFSRQSVTDAVSWSQRACRKVCRVPVGTFLDGSTTITVMTSACIVSVSYPRIVIGPP